MARYRSRYNKREDKWEVVDARSVFPVLATCLHADAAERIVEALNAVERG